ncbi:hypothetical protein CL619_00675 [archaeon]|nr:hypothetical protein [archaeon]
MDLDEKIKLVGRHFSPDEAIISGGLASYLNTNIVRNTDDVDLIVVSSEDLGDKKYNFQLETQIHIDLTQADYVFDSIDISNPELQIRAIKIKEYESGEKVSYLGPEALIATKLTCFCVSNIDGQPTEYGINVLRDRDLQDIRNLQKITLDEELMYDILGTVRQLEEVEDVSIFWEIAKRVLVERNAGISFKKSAFGIARFLATIPEEHREEQYQSLRDTSEEMQTGPFAIYVQKEKFLNAYEFQ